MDAIAAIATETDYDGRPVAIEQYFHRDPAPRSTKARAHQEANLRDLREDGPWGGDAILDQAFLPDC